MRITYPTSRPRKPGVQELALFLFGLGLVRIVFG